MARASSRAAEREAKLRGSSLPAVTAQEMREVDRLMLEDVGISLLQMMEQAGHHLARAAQRMAVRSAGSRQIVVLVGRGNNGGGGLVAARYLRNWGFPVRVVLAAPPESYKDAPAHQLAITRKLKMSPEEQVADRCLSEAALVVDALIGYGLEGPPHGGIGELIHRVNRSRAPVLSLDIPSGLDATSGVPFEPCMRARVTLTLALPKTGLLKRGARGLVGDLYLADIGVPAAVYERLGLEVGPIFRRGDVLKIRSAPARR